MATLEFTTIDANGVTTRTLSELSSSEKVALEWAIVNKDLEFKRTTPIPVGTCKVCEYAHEGLYCPNCFTGERVRCGKGFAKVMVLTPAK